MRKIAWMAAALLASAGPADAEPLVFGAVDGSRDLSQAAEVATCPDRAGGERVCALNRPSFGGLPVEQARLVLNAHGRARSATVALDAKDFDTAGRLLEGRYGPPLRSAAGPVWRAFDEGASIRLTRRGRQAIVAFDYPSNAAAETPGDLDARLIWAALAAVALACMVGLVLSFRRRRRRPAPMPEPAMSMKATLERKLREGNLRI